MNNNYLRILKRGSILQIITTTIIHLMNNNVTFIFKRGNINKMLKKKGN